MDIRYEDSKARRSLLKRCLVAVLVVGVVTALTPAMATEDPPSKKQCYLEEAVRADVCQPLYQPRTLKIPIKAKGTPIPKLQRLGRAGAASHEECWRFDLRGVGTNRWGHVLYEFEWSIAWCGDGDGHIVAYPWAECAGRPVAPSIVMHSKSCPKGTVGYYQSPVKADWHFEYTYSEPTWDYYPMVRANVYADGGIEGTAWSA